MKKNLLFLNSKFPKISTCDKSAFQNNNSYNFIYNKLLLSKLQNLDAAPVGIIPIEFPVVIKPIINLYGMSNGYTKINNIDDYNKSMYIGMFWQKYLNGIQYNVDLNIKNGKIIQYFCVISEPSNDGMFKYHYFNKNYLLPKNIYDLIENILDDYSGFLNIEVIDNFIIEMHLRLNGDLFLYNEQNLIDMINLKKINIINTCFFPIFVDKYFNIDITNYLETLDIEYDLDGAICNNYKRLLYFRYNNLEKGIIIQNKIYNYINELK